MTPTTGASEMRLIKDTRDQYGLKKVFNISNVLVAFRWIPPGSFTVSSMRDTVPDRKVAIDRGFWLGETQVTRRLWGAVTRTISDPEAVDRGKPVAHVSWHECLRFCSALAGDHARLPTADEWEHALQAGAKWPGGRSGQPLTDLAWFRENSGGSTHPVGEKAANPWGLYDMLGNVREWCVDDTLEGGCVVQGGSYEDYARVPPRGYVKPFATLPTVGFRIALGK